MTHVSATGAAALTAAALALGGCGEDRSASTITETAPSAARRPAPAREPAPARVKLSETEYRLDPVAIRVDRPATLEIHVHNAGSRGHALAVEASAGERRTRVLGPGAAETLRVRLDSPGRYRWYCPVEGHAKRGMRGTIAVARGGG
ncbi:MAG: hypothetical protein QOE06_1736 [Thermoleophilaceae bacterium]|nr:hypothetical protein [Thermoleophilaceae bacterium]